MTPHQRRAHRLRLYRRLRLPIAAFSAIGLFALVLIGAVVTAAEGRWITVEATAYCPCSLCCEGSDDGITANGTLTSTTPYGSAASPDLPLGSRVYIPTGAGYLDQSRPMDRWFPIDDRGSALRAEWKRSGITRLDLRYRTHWSAQQFGRKLMLVFIAN